MQEGRRQNNLGMGEETETKLFCGCDYWFTPSEGYEPTSPRVAGALRSSCGIPVYIVAAVVCTHVLRFSYALTCLYNTPSECRCGLRIASLYCSTY